MTAFAEAVLAQPAQLRASAAAAQESLDAVDLTRWRSGSLVVAAIGASHHAAVGFVHALRSSGRRASLLSPAELVAERGRARELADAFVLVSQSGRSAETVAAARALHGAPRLAVTTSAATPLAAACDATLALGELADTPVATLSYTATLQALALLAPRLTDAPREDPERIATLAAEVLDACAEPVAALVPDFAEIATLDAVGPGGSAGSAYETALLAREGLRLPATGMETREYLHGPMESVAPGLGAVLFGGDRERRLAATLRELGATVALVDEPMIPDAAPLVRPLLEILPVQLLVERVAAIRGLPIGELRRSQDDTKVAVAG